MFKQVLNLKLFHLKLLLGSCIVLISACSSQELYETAQKNRVQNCQTKPIEEQASCLSDLNKKSYKDYEKSRQDISKK